MFQLFLYYSLQFLPKNFDSLLNTVLGQYGLVFDVGWWSGLNKCGDGDEDIYIGFGNIIEDTGTNNQVATSHWAPIGSFTTVVYGGSIL